MSFIYEPWPWYVSGPLIGLVMLTLVKFGKGFGMSSNLSTLCAIGGAGKFSKFFKFDWKAKRWNLYVVLGAILGGYIAAHWMSIPNQGVQLNQSTVDSLVAQGFKKPEKSLYPLEIFSWKAVSTFKGFMILFIGGLLVGFGTRWAGGCTSGHAISGLSNLQWPSLIAVIGFFLGGLIMTHLIFPFLFL